MRTGSNPVGGINIDLLNELVDLFYNKRGAILYMGKTKKFLLS